MKIETNKQKTAAAILVPDKIDLMTKTTTETRRTQQFRFWVFIHGNPKTNGKDRGIHTFIAASFTIAKIWKQPKCPSTDEWIKKWYVCTTEYYSAIKKNEILPSATWKHLDGIVLSEISYTEKDKNHTLSLHARSKKQQRKLTDTEKF
uniref:Uncharacterized protein n=1 Tax=Rousettus aegyptiacus TaxID=9407 RepID=A0A7J8B9P2_ROUAE|nr:hypothetical protein HJG63_009983 [Rousettus aegyptiacus]